MLSEFKTFLAKGNIVDLAIGIIIGAAFNKIVQSLVNDILMPTLSLALGKVNISNLKYTINADISINYGMFIQNIIDFLVIAFALFIFIKYYNKLLNYIKK